MIVSISSDWYAHAFFLPHMQQLFRQFFLPVSSPLAKDLLGFFGGFLKSWVHGDVARSF